MKQVKHSTKAANNNPKYYGDRRRSITVLAIISLIAIIFAGLFTWKYLSKNNTGTGGEKVYTTITLSETEQYIEFDEPDKDIIIGKNYNNAFFSTTCISIDDFSVYCEDKLLEKGTDYSIIYKQLLKGSYMYDFSINGNAIKGPIKIGETREAPKTTVKFDSSVTDNLGVFPDFAFIGYDYIGDVQERGMMPKKVDIDYFHVTISEELIELKIKREGANNGVHFEISADDLKNKDPVIIFAKLVQQKNI